MKNKTITTGVCELFVCELPHGANGPYVFNDKDKPYIFYFAGVEAKRLYLEQFGISEQFDVLGRLPDITEYQWGDIVDKSIYTGLYGHYVKGITLNTYCYKSPRDSFHTLLTANGILFDNNFGEEPKYSHYNYGNAYPNPSERKRFERDFKDWQEAQKHVWDIKRTHLFIKQN